MRCPFLRGNNRALAIRYCRTHGTPITENHFRDVTKMPSGIQPTERQLDDMTMAIMTAAATMPRNDDESAANIATCAVAEIVRILNNQPPRAANAA